MNPLASFAQELISRLAWTSAQAVLLVGVIWLVGRQLPRLPAATRSLLWWLLGVQLLLGLAMPTPVALPLLSPASAPAPVVAAPVVETYAAPSEHHITGFNQPALGASDGMAEASVAKPASMTPSNGNVASMRWQTAVLALWLAGVLVQIVIAMRQWREARAVVRASQPLDDASLQAACMVQARAMGLRRCPSLRVSPEIRSPQVSGLWRPMVLLPMQQSLSADESALALAHELTHLRRGDLWMGWIPAIAQRLFFFHPLVAWAMREYALHREAACDAQVLQQHDAPPQAYGRLLLRLGVAHPLHAGLAGASPTFLNLKRRLSMLQHAADAKPRAPGWMLVVLIAIAGVLPYRVTQATADQSAPTPASGAMPAPATSAAAPAAQAASASVAKPAANAAPAVAARPAAAPVASHDDLLLAVPPVPPTPPTPRTPPTPLTPPTPRTPPTPLTPPTPRTPPTPPTPPTAPVPPSPPSYLSDLHAHHIDIDIDNDARDGFALFSAGDESVTLSGTDRDISSARRARKADEPLLWFRHGQQAYVVRDAATIERAHAAYAPMREMAGKQSELARAESRLASAQSRIAAQQGAVAARNGQLMALRGQLDAQRAALQSKRAVLESQQGVPPGDLRELDGQIRGIDNEIRRIAERERSPADDPGIRSEQAGIERQQAELERQHKELEQREHTINGQADQQIHRLLEEAIAKGVAQPTKL